MRAIASLSSTVLLGLIVVACITGPSRAQRVDAGALQLDRRSAAAGSFAGMHLPFANDRNKGPGPAGRGATVWPGAQRRYAPVGHIEIPAIDLDVAFYLGIHDDVIRRGPGLWPGTPLPGYEGNSVLAGHRTTHTHPFEDLDLLAAGDVIRARLRSGPTTTFRVWRTAVVPEIDYVDYVLRQPGRPRVRQITVFACTPKGSRTHRIVVQARAVGRRAGAGIPKSAMGGAR
jgi:LPXTG-site transpeptidase (sortase) family protein